MNFDLHTHTSYSDGKADVETMIFCAEALELSAFAVTDHLQAAAPTAWVDEMVARVEKARTGLGFPILTGVEADITDVAGGASITADVRRKIDIVLAHWSGVKMQEELGAGATRRDAVGQLVRTMIHICSNPLVDVVAHPFNLGRQPIKIGLDGISDADYRTIAAAFREGNKYFEVMNNIWWWFPDVKPSIFRQQYVHIIRIFASEGVRFSIGSDAHSAGGVGNISWSQRVLRDADVPQAQLIQVTSFLKKQRDRKAEESR